jgi:hypothetical protein
MIEIIVIAAFFIIIAAFLYLIYLGNKNNPMSISATEDIMKINNVTEIDKHLVNKQINYIYLCTNDFTWVNGLHTIAK